MAENLCEEVLVHLNQALTVVNNWDFVIVEEVEGFNMRANRFNII